MAHRGILDDFIRMTFPIGSLITHSQVVSNFLFPGVLMDSYPQIAGMISKADHLSWSDTFACGKRYAIRDAVKARFDT